MKWGALLVVVMAVAAIWLWHYHVDEQIRARIENHLVERYPGRHVTVESARIVNDVGIEVRGVQIQDAEGGTELAYLDEVLLTCATTPQRLLSGKPDIRHTTIRRGRIQVTRRADGTWNVGDLLPETDDFDGPVAVTIEDGTVHIVDPLRDPASVFTLHSAQLRVTRPAASQENHSAQDVFASEKAGRQFRKQGSEQPSYPARDTSPESSSGRDIHIEGTVAGEHTGRVEVEARFDPQSGRVEVRGNVPDASVTPGLLASLPAFQPDDLGSLASLRCDAQLRFFVGRATMEAPWQYAVEGRIEEGQFIEPMLPYPVTGLTARFELSESGFRVERFQARCGQGRLSGSVHKAGAEPQAPIRLHVIAEDLRLDDNLAQALPEDLQRQWHRFQPSGVCDVRLELERRNRQWDPRLTVTCKDVALLYEDFPYPVEHARGTVRYRDATLDFDLTAMAGVSPLTIRGRITDPAEDALGWIEVEATEAVPLDDRLFTALQDDVQRVVTDFHPRGAITFKTRIERDDPSRDKPHHHLVVRLHELSIRHTKFPYPQQRIRGTLEMIDGHWEFRDLEGRNDSGYITCSGRWTPHNEGGELVLDLLGSDIDLKDDLRDALSPNLQRVWSDLRPRGSIDHATVSLRWDSRDDDARIDVKAQKWAKTQNVEGRTISIEPVWFPYRLEEVTGNFRLRGNTIELAEVRARHEDVRVAFDAACTFTDAGAWRTRFERITVDRFRVDRDLLAALPEDLAQAAERLNLEGPVMMTGSMEFQGARDRPGEVAANWDVTFDLENANMDCGVKLDHIHGGVRLRGEHSAKGTYSRGELSVDSVFYAGHQFTQVHGPLYLDKSQLTLGVWAADPGSDQAPRQVECRLLNGTLRGDAHVAFGEEATFTVRANLDNGDLARFARENIRTPHSLSGKAHAAIRLGGASSGMHTLQGSGYVRLREADIYELPVMVALLKVLSIRKPDKTAFTSSNIDFRIEGDHVYLDRIDFNGDAVSLKGVGAVNFDRKIEHMEFYTMVGRASHLPIIRPLLGEASRQLLVIRVWGTLDNPRTKRQALPALNETLQTLFPEAGERVPPGEGPRLAPGDIIERGLAPFR